MNYPFNNGLTPYNYQPKTPQQLQQELAQLQNQYSNQYNQYLNLANNQRNTLNNNSIIKPTNGGRYFYVDSYDDVINAEVPFDGSTDLYVCNNIIWSKKLENGKPYVNAYNFSKIVNYGEPKKDNKSSEEEKDNVSNNELTLESLYEYVNKINENLNSVSKRIDNLDKSSEVANNG